MADLRRNAHRRYKRFAIALLLGLSGPATAQGVERWHLQIEEASARFGIPSAWIERVMKAESGGRTRIEGWLIRSRAGAMGLMQLMPATWAEMRRTHRLGGDPDDPRDNVLAGTAYLRAMYDRFGYPGLFAAYSAGPGRYARHLERGTPLPLETLAYLAQVSGAAKPSARGWGAPVAVRTERSGIFAIRAADPRPNGSPASGLAGKALFVIRPLPRG